MRSSHLLVLVTLVAFVAGSLYLISSRMTWDPAASRPPTEAQSVSGSVRDSSGPVGAARVRFQGAPQSVFTDAAGRFDLARPRSPAQRLTAWKEGFLIGGVSANDSPLDILLARLPQEDNESYAWVDPTPDATQSQNCGNCHGEIYREWSAGGHARSVNNRRFRNLLDGSDWNGRAHAGWNLLAEHPDGAGVCASCHAPTITSFNDPAFSDLRQAHGVAAHGVHCDYCHKIADVGDGAFGLTHGRFNLKLLRPTKGQIFFGPLDDVDRNEDSYSPLYKDSRYCASCHEGVVFGVHVYSTYSEWLDSPARREGKQCQTCHMAPTGSMRNFAPGKGGIERDPKTLGNHRFFAGSQEAMLREAVRVKTEWLRRNEGVYLTITVTADGAGHRVPTGFIDRHLILLVEGFDGADQPVAALAGPTLPEAAGRDVAGAAGKLYAKLLQDETGKNPRPFWRPGAAAVDSRLVPGRPDQIEVLFPSRTKQARVRLIHRKFWQDVASSKGWPQDDLTVVDQFPSDD